MSTVPQVSPVLPKLAERIRRGEVVFFVGAGFSIDSEGMSAKEILWRIWIRLEALCAVVDAAQGGTGNGEQTWNRFRRTFLRDPSRKATLRSGEDHAEAVAGEIDWLVVRYYEVNDWICDAFGRLIVHAMGLQETGAFLDCLAAKDAELFGNTGKLGRNKRPAGKPSALPSWIPAQARRDATTSGASAGRESLQITERQLGKLALMATFGFFDEQVLGGVCHGLDASEDLREEVRDIGKVAARYDGRLRLRHHVLARLAREGLCPSLITTNFDMLLEGALRLSGFELEPGNDGTDGTKPTPDNGRALGASLALQIPFYDVISDPTGFYRRGKAYRTATLLKIHGCAGLVRSLTPRDAAPGTGGHVPSGESGAIPDVRRRQMLAYLPQVVYTYREIQNWREDHWTADLLRTVLRTRTLVFAGYSTADPVVHDTFRSVYEEMEQRATPLVADSGATPGAPAYFLGYSGGGDSVEFHAHQVLRSASRAVGQSHDDHEHPHYVRFGGEENPHGLLGLDETIGLLAHEVLRAQQQDALRAEIAAVIARLTGNRKPRSEIETIQMLFAKMTEQEKTQLPCDGRILGDASRFSLRRALAWSMGFHPALRREWALALALGQGHAKAGRALDLERTMRHPLWYFPASERPAWTAWSAVVEMAFRNMAKVLCDKWSKTGETPPIEPTYDAQPTVMLPYGDGCGRPSRLSLSIEMQGLGRPDKLPKVTGYPTRKAVWQFSPESLPWTASVQGLRDAGNGSADKPASMPRTSHVAVMLQPGADWIWKRALRADIGDKDEIQMALGITDAEAEE